MIWGMSELAFTRLHVVISLAGIASGLVVLFGLLARKRLDTWTAVFLATNIATSVTGFAFPFVRLLPAHIVGVLSLLALAIAVVARYPCRLAGGWRRTYVASAAVALYLNVLVAVVQAFQKVPALNALAPTQSEAPFIIAQLIVLCIIAALTVAAARNFRDAPAPLAARAAKSGG